MPISLGPHFNRSLLLALAFAGLLYCHFCTRSFRAWELAEAGNLQNQTRATELEPQNAVYWRQLGDMRLYQENDPEASLLAFRRATELNPRDADAWIGTASALQVLDRPNDEHQAISHALAAEPRRLEVVWQAGNLYAALGDRGLTLAQVCVLLKHNRVRAKEAFELARHVSLNKNGNVVDCDPPEAAH